MTKLYGLGFKTLAYTRLLEKETGSIKTSFSISKTLKNLKSKNLNSTS